jgi:hypothetical protein
LTKLKSGPFHSLLKNPKQNSSCLKPSKNTSGQVKNFFSEAIFNCFTERNYLSTKGYCIVVAIYFSDNQACGHIRFNKIIIKLTSAHNLHAKI